MQLGGHADFIWSHVFGLMITFAMDVALSVHQILCNSQKKRNGDAGSD
jgi:heme exporter protein D